MKKTISSITTATTLLLSSATLAFAQTGPIKIQEGALSTTMSGLTLPAIISGLIRILVIAAAVVFFVWLVLGGIRWITSGGDKAKTEEARNQITAALVGLVVVFSAWAIAQLINTLFDVNLFELQIKELGT